MYYKKSRTGNFVMYIRASRLLTVHGDKRNNLLPKCHMLHISFDDTLSSAKFTKHKNIYPHICIQNAETYRIPSLYCRAYNDIEIKLPVTISYLKELKKILVIFVGKPNNILCDLDSWNLFMCEPYL